MWATKCCADAKYIKRGYWQVFCKRHHLKKKFRDFFSNEKTKYCHPAENHKPPNPELPQMRFNIEISHRFACQHVRIWAIKWRPLVEILDGCMKKAFDSFKKKKLLALYWILYDPVFHDATVPGTVGAPGQNKLAASNVLTVSSAAPTLAPHLLSLLFLAAVHVTHWCVKVFFHKLTVTQTV